MRLEIHIQCGNAAFCEDDDTGDDSQAAGAECQRILRQLGATLASDGLNVGDTHRLYDVNGNKVGVATVL